MYSLKLNDGQELYLLPNRLKYKVENNAIGYDDDENEYDVPVKEFGFILKPAIQSYYITSVGEASFHAKIQTGMVGMEFGPMTDIEAEGFIKALDKWINT